MKIAMYGIVVKEISFARISDAHPAIPLIINLNGALLNVIGHTNAMIIRDVLNIDVLCKLFLFSHILKTKKF
jgi:hypothetical protein